MKFASSLICVLVIFVFVFAGCATESTTKIEDNNKPKKNDVVKKPKNNGADLICDDKEESTTCNGNEKEIKKGVVYYQPKNDNKKDNNKINYKDREVSKAISEINIACRALNYDKAYEIYKDARKIEPISESAQEKLRDAGNDIRPFIEAFRAIYQKTYRKDLVVISLRNADTYMGAVVDKDEKHGYLVLQNYSTNSYVSIRTRDIAENNKMSFDQQKKMRQIEFDEAAYEYIAAEESPMNYLMLAKLAWRYDMEQEAYKYLRKSLNMDDEYVRQTISLLEDSDYKKFMELYKEDKLEEAHKILTKLVSKYPKADLFKKPAQKINEHVEEVERLKEEEKQRIAEEIMAKKKAEEEEFRRRMEEEKKKEEEAKKKAEEEEKERKRRELDKMAELDENSEVLKEKLKLSGPELIREAQKEYRLAVKLDKAALPGAEDADKILEGAIYHYQFAKRLFQEAENKGQDTMGMVVKINRALFWCRKRRIIH